MNKIGLILLATLAPVFTSMAWADSASMPIHQLKKPPVDLVDKDGNKLDASAVAGLAQQGVDISTLNPVPDKMWQNWGGQWTGRSLPASDFTDLNFPVSAEGVKWQYDEASSDDSYMARYMSRVQSITDPTKNFRMTLSRSAHSALLRAALLRKIGYYIPSPKLYRDLKVQFSSEQEKNDFLKNSQAGMGTDFDSRHWVTANDPTTHSLTFASAVLEIATPKYYDLAWGIAPPANNPANVAALQYFSNYRSFRALIIPYVLADIPESLNRYSPKVGGVMGDQIVLTHPFAQSFSAVDFQDARWLVRRILSLNKSELREIVEAAQLPPQLVDLTYAKFVYRIKNLSELFSNDKNFDLVKLFKIDPLPDLKVSSSDGIVKDGKVTQELITGYPQRFSHGDRQSPYSEGDLFRYLKIDALSSSLGALVDKMNQTLLQARTIQDVATQHQQDVYSNLLQQFQKNPFQPLQQQVSSWGGFIGGANMRASRHISTGTYFNSTATLQLVDDVSVSGNLGYFASLDGLKTSVLPIANASLAVTREYSHVRPLNSVTESGKVSWGNLLVPAFMTSVSKVLDGTALVKSDNPDDPPQYPLDKFMLDLRDGEVFVITDSVSTSAALQLATPIDALMGITPLSFVNSMTLEGDASKVILGQTVIMRTKEGFQVFLRKQNGTVLGSEFDINFFVKLFSARIQRNNSTINTDAFVLDYDPNMISNLDLTDPKNQKYLDLRNNLRLTIRSLLKGNDSEFLYSKFKDRMFKLNHELVTTETRRNFLAWTAQGFKETHLLKVTPPTSMNAPASASDDSILLMDAKRGQLVGRDPITGLIINLFNGILGQKKVPFTWASATDPNPANSLHGKAFWKMIDSQTDLTDNNPKYPVSAYVQHVWGGWTLKQSDFFKLVDEIETGLADTQLAPYHLIDKAAFTTVQSIDFYRITEQVSILDSGIYRLRDLITEPQVENKPVEKKKWLAGFFQKISGTARANDKELFSEMMKLLGAGDYDAGYHQYMEACESQQTSKNGDSSQSSSTYYRGSNYECLVPWMERLIDLSHSFPADKKAQAVWMREVLYTIDGNISFPLFLKYLGKENYLFFVRVNGFRKGDEDGDLEFFSNTIGQPPNQFDYSNGLINYWSTKARISPLEMNRTNGAFQ